MPAKKMLVLGLDGFDPVLAERFMEEGRLPHLKKLAETGGYRRLATSNPPQSPVAWSCLIGGANPGHHDVFDFIVRDPATYLPEIGMTQKRKSGMKELFSGLTAPAVETRRKGPAFWDVLGAHGIKCTVLRMPVTFPATALNGRLLSGMGTPDIRGTQGVFTFFSTAAPSHDDRDTRGRFVPVQWKGNRIDTELAGPRIQAITGSKDATTPLRLEKGDDGSIRLTVNGATTVMAPGSWSPWMRLRFPAGVGREIFGTVRFHLTSAQPDLALYATAINIDPQSPAMPISFPTDYAKELFDRIGPYYTQGMPYDTWAMNEGKLSEEDFLEQAYAILDENLSMMRFELDRFDSGLLFCYFGITDLVSHMFWRYSDPQHPKKGTSQNPKVVHAIRDVYERMDAAVGEALSKVGPDTAVLVVSDHGFTSFRRAVHLNSWLRDQGFLVLKDKARVGSEFFQNVDWDATRAYSVGFGGIYVNQFNRERSGTVYKGAETEELKKDIAAKLLALRDADSARVVKRVYTSQELYRGPYETDGPDLFVGFDRYYRASWQTGLGAAPDAVIEDNDRLWGGDHLCDPDLVPGVLFSNLKLRDDSPTLFDVAPTIVDYFGLPPSAEFEGRSLRR